MEDYLSPQDIADKLGLNVHTIYKYLREGDIKGSKIGNKYRIAESDLKNFLKANPITEQDKVEDEAEQILIEIDKKFAADLNGKFRKEYQKEANKLRKEQGKSPIDWN